VRFLNYESEERARWRRRVLAPNCRYALKTRVSHKLLFIFHSHDSCLNVPMPQSALERLAFPGVVALISFLAYGSQFLFPNLEPHPLKQKQTLIFNVLVACIWITYVRACFTNPGSVPSNRPTIAAASEGGGLSKQKQRWCRKCETYKPPRAHHCKVCQRCIPKMDHHCPWTINCVSHRTFPHFFRFLCYSVASMFYLEYLLFIRAAVVWSDRNLPIVSNQPSLPALQLILHA
jgi:palmitoyltransferase